MREVGVVIVNWNGGDVAVDSVRSVLAQRGVQVKVWVVDNASTDGSLARIAALGDRVTVIRNADNRVFAAANNQALPMAWECDFVLLLNNDAVLPDGDGLARAVAELDAGAAPSVAGACGRYEYPDGDFQRFYNDLPSALDLLVAFGPGRFVPLLRRSRSVRRFMMEDADFSREMLIRQPAFACVLLRSEAARRVGLFDEQFPLFFNDVDYCKRWHEAGYAIKYLPWWRVVHHQSRSTARLGGARTAELLSSVVRYARKHWGRLVGVGFGCASFVDAIARVRSGEQLALSPWSVARGRSLFDTLRTTRAIVASDAGAPPSRAGTVQAPAGEVARREGADSSLRA